MKIEQFIEALNAGELFISLQYCLDSYDDAEIEIHDFEEA